MNNELTQLVSKMYGLQKRCYEMIEQVYGPEKKIQFPVDIKKIADYKEIQICFAPLNYGGGNKIDQNIAQLRFDVNEEGNVIKKIILDDEMGRNSDDVDNLSDLERYAVAYEIGKTIIEGEHYEAPEKSDIAKLNLFSVPYSLPRLSAQLENFEYEMCAIFLLLPMRQFLEEFSTYIEEIREHPVMMDRWIGYLSSKAEIPNYQLVNGYQYIKLCAYQYYTECLAEIDETLSEDEKVRLMRLRNLFQ